MSKNEDVVPLSIISGVGRVITELISQVSPQVNQVRRMDHGHLEAAFLFSL